MSASSALLAAIFAVISLSPVEAHPTPQPSQDAANSMAAAIPEIIFVNGVIYTGAGLDEDKPQTVQAMAVGGGRVR